MTIDPGSVPKAAIPTLDDDYENDTEAVDRLVKMKRISSSSRENLNSPFLRLMQGEQVSKVLQTM